MASIPAPIAEFLTGERLAVAGVSRSGRLPANAIFRRLRDVGYQVSPINPTTDEVEGVPCYPDVLALPEAPDGVVIATHPDVAAGVVEQCAQRGVRQVWFHRSFGDGSVSDEAIRACERLGIDPIVGGCPLMFCGKVDLAHRCMRWWLQRKGRVPRNE
jgi:hypothetical protein